MAINNNNESNSGLWFLVGAVVIAVAGILWYLNSGAPATSPAAGGDTNVTVTAPATPTPAAPAATDAPAAPAGGAASTTTESTTTTTTTEPAKTN